MMKKTMTLLGLPSLSAACYAQESLQAMYARVPAPPATAAAAAAWLGSPAVTQLQAQIKAQRAGIEKAMASATSAQQPAGMPEDFAKVLAALRARKRSGPAEPGRVGAPKGSATRGR